MSTAITLYYSYACQGSYRVHAWLRETGRDLAVDWRPYAIRTHGQVDYWGQAWYSADSELRGFVATEAAARQGRQAAAAFRAALFDAIHEGGLDLGDEQSLLVAGQQAGLDLVRFQADWQDPDLIQTIQAGQLRAIENPGVFGTPTMVFADGRVVQIELAGALIGQEAQRLLDLLIDPAKGPPRARA